MHALSVTGAALSLYSLSLDLLTRSDSVPCPMAVPCGHRCVRLCAEAVWRRDYLDAELSH